MMRALGAAAAMLWALEAGAQHWPDHDGNLKAVGITSGGTGTVAEICVNTDGNGGGDECLSSTGAATIQLEVDSTARFACTAATCTATADVVVSNASGAMLENAASSSTNPTLIPNRAATGTGVGGTGGSLFLFVGGLQYFELQATDLIIASGTNLNARGGIYSSVGRLTIEDDLTVENTTAYTVQSVTGTSTGDASPRAITLTPTRTFVEIDCQDPDTCDVTMDETGMVKGQIVYIVISGATGAVDFADTPGVSEIAGAFAAGINDSITLIYGGSAWLQLDRSDN